MLTKRQLEFLKALVKLYEEKGMPIHYSEVGRGLKVSKWTAYDVMNSLLKNGYLDVEHLLEKGPGRSMVLYLPTAKAYEALEMTPEETEDWSKVREHLLGKVVQAHEQGIGVTMRETLLEMSRSKSPLFFCACAIVLLLLAIAAVEKGTECSVIMGYLMSALTAPHLALMLFAGAALALILGSPVEERQQLTGLDALVSDYEANLKMVGPTHQKALIEFAQEAGELLGVQPS